MEKQKIHLRILEVLAMPRTLSELREIQGDMELKDSVIKYQIQKLKRQGLVTRQAGKRWGRTDEGEAFFERCRGTLNDPGEESNAIEREYLTKGLAHDLMGRIDSCFESFEAFVDKQDDPRWGPIFRGYWRRGELLKKKIEDLGDPSDEALGKVEELVRDMEARLKKATETTSLPREIENLTATANKLRNTVLKLSSTIIRLEKKSGLKAEEAHQGLKILEELDCSPEMLRGVIELVGEAQGKGVSMEHLARHYEAYGDLFWRGQRLEAEVKARDGRLMELKGDETALLAELERLNCAIATTCELFEKVKAEGALALESKLKELPVHRLLPLLMEARDREMQRLMADCDVKGVMLLRTTMQSLY